MNNESKVMKRLENNARQWRKAEGCPPCPCDGANKDCSKCDGTGFVFPKIESDDADYVNCYVGLDYDGDGV